MLETLNLITIRSTVSMNSRRFVRLGIHVESDGLYLRISLGILWLSQILPYLYISMQQINFMMAYFIKNLIYFSKCLLFQQLQLLLRKGKQTIKKGFSECKNSLSVKIFKLPLQWLVLILKKPRLPYYSPWNFEQIMVWFLVIHPYHTWSSNYVLVIESEFFSEFLGELNSTQTTNQRQEEEIVNLKTEVEKLKQISRFTNVVESCEQLSHLGITDSGTYILDFDGKSQGQVCFILFLTFPACF